MNSRRHVLHGMAASGAISLMTASAGAAVRTGLAASERRPTRLGRIDAGGTDLEVEAFGNPRSTPMVLIMGFGAQLTRWPAELCGLLAAAGYYVVRFDNRDVGLSERFAGRSYTLADMAGDVIALLDALKMRQAHLVGASMGAMIAQLVSTGSPNRILSLASIMSPSGNPAIPLESGALDGRPSEFMGSLTPNERIAHDVAYRMRLRGGDDGGSAELEAEVRRDFERSYDPAGMMRQGAAMAGYHDRRSALAGIRVPTVVIQGDVDPIVPIAAAKDIASRVPKASLVVISGMGHDLTRKSWTRVTEAIISNARRGDRHR